MTEKAFNEMIESFIPNEMPYSIAKGSFKKELGIDVDCYVLDNGKRVFSKNGLVNAVGLSQKGGALEKFFEGKDWLNYPVTQIQEKIKNPLIFTHKKSVTQKTFGYEATTLIDICKAIANASKNKRLIRNSQAILSASGKVGIIALIDQVAGYRDPNQTAYIEAFKIFIREEASQWEKQFPDEFYETIYRLYKLDGKAYSNHPQFFAILTRNLIYKPLAKSKGAILEILEDKNPLIKGQRKKRLHQFLEDIGKQALTLQIGKVIGHMEQARDEKHFKILWEKATGNQLQFPFEDLD